MDPQKVKTGADLKAWRGKRSQAAVAGELRTSQRMISAREAAAREPLPPWLAARVRGEEDEGIESSVQSWPRTLFRALRAKASKRADEVAVRAIISPAKEGVEYADYVAQITFERLTIPEGQTLHLDHVRDPGDDRSLIYTPGVRRPRNAPFNLVLGGTEQMPESLQMKDGKQHEVLVRQGEGALLLDQNGRTNDLAMHVSRTVDHGAVRARLKEDDRMHMPAFLAYELWGDARDPITVYVRSDEGFNTATSDAVGFTYYTEADFIVERIRLEVEFRGGLIPSPELPVARAQLIRRTTLRPANLNSNLPDPKMSNGSVPGSIRYTFGPLLRPKGGFLYSIAWQSITRPDQRRR